MDWEPRGAWKTVVAIGRLARQHNAASGDAALFAGEPDQISLKRREWDSNPRGACAPTGFRNRRLEPLSHLSSIPAAGIGYRHHGIRAATGQGECNTVVIEGWQYFRAATEFRQSGHKPNAATQSSRSKNGWGPLPGKKMPRRLAI